MAIAFRAFTAKPSKAAEKKIVIVEGGDSDELLAVAFRDDGQPFDPPPVGWEQVPGTNVWMKQVAELRMEDLETAIDPTAFWERTPQ